jgi:zinc transporter
MPLCAYDIADDGTATAALDTAPTGDGTYRWLHFDLSDPDLAAWAATHIPELPAAALLQSQTRPRCDRQDDGLILNLRGVNLNSDGPADQMVSVRLWVTDQTVVTVWLRKVFALDDLRQACDKGSGPKSSADFIYTMSEALTRRVQDVVFDLADRVEDIEEDQIDSSISLPPDMGELRRQAIRLRRYLGPQRDALQRLSEVTQGDRAAQREVAHQTMLHVEELDALNGRLNALQDQHDSQACAAHGRNSYVLSIVAAVFLPLGFLTGVFGVNVGGMPGVDHPAAFTFLCLGMAALGVALMGVLRWLRWI